MGATCCAANKDGGAPELNTIEPITSDFELQKSKANDLAETFSRNNNKSQDDVEFRIRSSTLGNSQQYLVTETN